MPIAATDLLPYMSLNRPEDDTALAGGGRDLDVRPGLTQLAANDDIEAFSSAAGDTTQTVTARGRNAAGAIVDATAALNGTAVIIFTPATIFERILFLNLSADAVGTVTIRRSVAGATVYVIPIAERGSSIFFIDSSSESGATVRWDKLFWLNNHGSLTLNSADVTLTADPATNIQQMIETAKNDTDTITNRKTTPGHVAVDDSVAQAVPTGILAAAEAIGVWYQMNLAADQAPVRSTFTSQLAGTSV